MSRITESLRSLIREEVQKSLRRKLLEGRAPQDIVRQIQTVLGTSSIDGIWGKATDAAWSAWLTKNATIIELVSDKTIDDLKANWAANSKDIVSVKGIQVSFPIKGTPEGMLEVLNLINDDEENDSRDIANAWSETPKKSYAEEPMKVVAQGYNEIIAYANAKAKEALKNNDIQLHDEWLAHADTARARQSQATIVKTDAAANEILDKENAYLDDIDPEDTFEFSDSALASTQKDAADDAADRKAPISESRWMRLAGLLKG